MKEETKFQGWVRILVIILPYLFIVGIFQIIGGLLVGFSYDELNIDKTSEERLIIHLFSFTGTFLVVWLFVTRIDKERFVDIGFRIKNRFQDFWLGFVIGAVIMFLGFALLEFLDEIHFQKFNFSFPELIVSAFVFMLVSFSEEILLRGYVLRNLMYSSNKYIALLISSIIFSLMHGFNPNVDLIGLTNIFFAGILLGITYIHTKNLWFPIALHFSWNFFQALVGFNVSGQKVYSMITFTIDEQTLLNGGAFGFEGSIFALTSMLITIIALFLYYNKTEPHKIYLEEKQVIKLVE